MVNDTEDGAVVEFTTGSSQSGVVSRVVVDSDLGKHSQIFDLGLSQLRAVGSDQDHLGLVLTQSLDGSLGSQNGLSGLHDQLETTVDRVLLLLLRSLKDNGGMEERNGLDTDFKRAGSRFKQVEQLL